MYERFRYFQMSFKVDLHVRTTKYRRKFRASPWNTSLGKELNLEFQSIWTETHSPCLFRSKQPKPSGLRVQLNGAPVKKETLADASIAQLQKVRGAC